MKKTLGAATLALASTLCAAQGTNGSNVTLYGRFDVGIDYINNVRQSGAAGAYSRWHVESGDWGASWLGLKGSEDLGGGNAAVFNLEQGLDLMDGSVAGASAGTGTAFSRKATVGLQSRQYGTVLAGRDLLMSNNQWEMDPLMDEQTSAATLVRARNALIGNNMLQYISPTVAGLELQLQYAPSQLNDVTDPTYAGQYGRDRGLQLTYRTPRYVAMLQVNDLNDQYGKMSNIFISSRETFAGLLVNATSTLKLQVALNHLSAPDTAPGLADRADQWHVGVQYQISKPLQFTGGLFRIKVDGGAGDATHDAAGHATLLGLGVLYHFTPLTFLYLTGAHVSNAGGSNFGTFVNSPGTGNLDNPIQGGAQSSVYAGLVTGF